MCLHKVVGIGVVAAILTFVGCTQKMPVNTPRPPQNGDDSLPTPPPVVFPIHHNSPAWSRAGEVVYEDMGYVYVDSSGTAVSDTSLVGLWVVSPQSHQKRRLYPRGKVPTWSPSGNQLAFFGNGIEILDVENGSVHTIASVGFFPSWSQDGEYIAFDSGAGSAGEEIWVVQVDGTDQRKIGEPGRMPSWLLGDTAILCVRTDGGAFQREIYRIDVHGGEWSRITSSGGDKRQPKCSPDGSLIAFSCQHLNGSPQLFVVSTSGQGETRYTEDGGCSPSWSPDGTEIVFTRCSNANGSGDGVLWILNTFSGQVTQLTQKWTEQK